MPSMFPLPSLKHTAIFSFYCFLLLLCLSLAPGAECRSAAAAINGGAAGRSAPPHGGAK